MSHPEVQAASASRARNFKGWSLVTLLLSIPVWLLVFQGAVLSRDYDGGIFLSVGYGLADGLAYYVDLWDNKDPFFGVFMAAAANISYSAPFFMDLIWIPLASLGVYLLARSLVGVVSADRALFLSLYCAPIIVVGPSYIAGWTHTPGTALVLLGWGLLAANRWVLGGLVIGLLLFVKVTVWPIAILGLVVLVLGSRQRREAAVRAVVAMVIMIAVSIAVLGVLGWLPGFIESFRLNSTYAGTMIFVFGYEDSVSGHLGKFMADILPGTLVALLVLIAISVLGLVVGWRTSTSLKSPNPQLVIAVLLVVSLVGTFAVFALTYLWPHHLQAASLPLILGAVTAATLIPQKWGYLLWVVIMVLITFVLSGWGSISALTTHLSGLSQQYESRIQEISEVPIDAFMLNTLKDGEYTYARLGTNDDRGYLGSVREGVTLGCPYFHLYDFSPVEAFADQLECMRTVDSILVTENFEDFANSMNRVSTNNLLDYVNGNFLCATFEDRKLCTRR